MVFITKSFEHEAKFRILPSILLPSAFLTKLNYLNILSYFSAFTVGTLPEKQMAAEFYKNSSRNSDANSSSWLRLSYPKLMISKIIWGILKINKFKCYFAKLENKFWTSSKASFRWAMSIVCVLTSSSNAVFATLMSSWRRPNCSLKLN